MSNRTPRAGKPGVIAVIAAPVRRAAGRGDGPWRWGSAVSGHSVEKRPRVLAHLLVVVLGCGSQGLDGTPVSAQAERDRRRTARERISALESRDQGFDGRCSKA